MLANVVLNWLLSALLLLVIASFLPGFELAGPVPALIAVVVIGLVNATLGLVLRAIAFPLTVLTLGLFALVINALVLKAAAALLPGFSIRGFSPALVAALMLALLHVVLRYSIAGNPAWV
jgi:putative membrane protein